MAQILTDAHYAFLLEHGLETGDPGAVLRCLARS